MVGLAALDPPYTLVTNASYWRLISTSNGSLHCFCSDV